MNTEQLESAKKLFFILLGIDIAITLVVGINAVLTVRTLADIQAGARGVDEALLSSLKFWEGFSKLIFLTTIGVGLGLVKWLNTCYRFAKDSLGATAFKNERWTTAGWIIPVFNLFKPYQIINEIFKAGAPTYTASDGWKKESGSGLLLTWWIFWAVTHLIGTIIGKQLLRGAMSDDVSLQQAIVATSMQVGLCVISIIIADLWLVVADTLTKRLIARSGLHAAKRASEQSVSEISTPIPEVATTQHAAAVGLVSNQQQASDSVPDMKARYIAIATTIAILLASAFPPFQITIKDRVIDLGYSFLFSPPLYRESSQLIGSVNLGMLFAEYVGILAIGALTWLFATSIPSAWIAVAKTGKQSAYAKWLRIRAGAATGIVIVAAILGYAFMKGAVRTYFHPPSKVVFDTPSAQGGVDKPPPWYIPDDAKPAREEAAKPAEVKDEIVTFPNGGKYVGEIKDNKFNGQGTSTLPDGRTYVGEFKDGNFNGQGTYTWPNGRKYVGAWRDGRFNGRGTQTFPNGNTYVGEWRDDKRHGQGTLTLSNGQNYVGEWLNDKRHGQGTLTLQNGEKYVGEFKGDKPNGQGTYTWVSGQTYFGEFKDGKYSGHGTLTLPNGSKYVGNWLNDKRHGQGTQTFPNGDVYVGEWMDDERHGQGNQTFSNGHKYDGGYWGGKFNGQGTWTLPDGSKYAGKWLDGMRHGQGTYTWASGQNYVGDYWFDQPNGKGTWTWPNGQKYVGEFKDGKYSGQGTLTLPNGNTYVGEWRDGKFNGQGTEYRTDGTILQSGIYENDVFVRGR